MTKALNFRTSVFCLLAVALAYAPMTFAAPKKALQKCEAPLDENAVASYLDAMTTTVPWSSMSIRRIPKIYEAELKTARANIEALKKTKTPKNQEELQALIRALDSYAARLNRVMRVLDHYGGIASTPEVTKIGKKIDQLDSAFRVEFGQNQKIANLVARTLENESRAYKLTKANRRHLKEMKDEFARNGVYLKPAERARLSKIRQRLADLATSYRDNVTRHIKENPFHLPKRSDTENFPDNLKQAVRAQAKKAGVAGALLYLSPSQAAKALEYIEDRSTREALWRAFSRRAFDGKYNNRPVALETLKLRNEEAKILGYKNYAEEKLVGRIVNTPGKLEAFLSEMTKMARPTAEKDLAELREFANDRDGIEDFMPWDSGYYSRLLQVKKFNIDPEQLRPYLEYKNVMDNGVFAVYSRMHSVRFQESADEKPHPDVTIVDVIHTRTGDVVGRIYIDPFQRIGEKREGAWQMELLKQQMRPDGTRQIPIATVTTNFIKPKKGDVYLSPYEVETMLHEFGHAFHEILSQVEMELLAGTSVAWDLVELPSQLMENYVDYILENVARNPETGRKIPTKLLQKYQDSKNFMAASMVMAKMRSSYLDFRFHQYAAIDDVTDIYELEKELTRDFINLPESDFRSISTSLTHIFSGSYATGYYSYAFADVLVACVYSLFEKAGIWNEGIATKFREFILEVGGTEDASVAFRNVFGRDPEIRAYFKQIGILK